MGTDPLEFSFNSEVTSNTFRFTILDDADVEPDENVRFSLSLGSEIARTDIGRLVSITPSFADLIIPANDQRIDFDPAACGFGGNLDAGLENFISLGLCLDLPVDVLAEVSYSVTVALTDTPVALIPMDDLALLVIPREPIDSFSLILTLQLPNGQTGTFEGQFRAVANIDRAELCTQAVDSLANRNPVPASECQTLIDIYEAMDGDTSWRSNDNWAEVPILDTWIGVSTGVGPDGLGHVVGLNLANIVTRSVAITDTVLSRILDLPHLENLNLSGNLLENSLPLGLPSLTNLVTLNLENNRINGSLPVDIANFENIREIYLGNNLLSGAIPPNIGRLDDLTGFGI